MTLTLVAPLFQSPGHGDDVDTGPSPFFRDAGMVMTTTLVPSSPLSETWGWQQ